MESIGTCEIDIHQIIWENYDWAQNMAISYHKAIFRLLAMFGAKIWPLDRKCPYIMGPIIILPSLLMDINVTGTN